MAVDANQLLKMSPTQLDELFESSSAGPIPQGEAEGTAIVDPGTELAPIAANFVHYFAWQGKVFNPQTGELVNRVSPFGDHAVVAKVYFGSSWLDGKECIVLDYSHTSLIARRIRDEIREIAPDLYLGVVYWDRDKLINFSLAFPHSSTPQS